MPRTRIALLAAAFAAAGSTLPAAPAGAAESYDACTGFVTAVPFTISTPGVWCLNKNLSTSATAGQAIAINASNVVLDCNDFKLDGVGGGAATATYGISASNRMNVTVRHCTVLGFQQGIRLAGTGGGHVVEDNRVDSSTYVGILASGDGNAIRRNQVINVGGSTTKLLAYGISATGVTDVIDNTVAGVTATAGSESSAYGIYTASNAGGSVNGNRVRDVLRAGTKPAYGIYNSGAVRMALRNNDVAGDASAGSVGIRCGSTGNRVRNSTISGFATAMSGCGDATGNDVSN